MADTTLCPEADIRAAMDDGEFWAHVFAPWTGGPDHDEGDIEPPPSDEPDIAAPCSMCGAAGACGYDDEGRAMVHVTPADDDIDRAPYDR